jgi:DNA topoisomerase-1
MVVKDGRFGPYVTDGETNASLRRDDSVESITPLRGAELLAERRLTAGTKPKRATAAKKTTTGSKKAPAKSAPAKSSTGKKTTAAARKKAEPTES